MTLRCQGASSINRQFVSTEANTFRTEYIRRSYSFFDRFSEEYSRLGHRCCLFVFFWYPYTVASYFVLHLERMGDTTSMDGYPFTGEVLGLVNLEPCTNFTEMFQNYNYTDPENPSSGGAAVELTNGLNYTQLGSFPTPGYGLDDLPSSEKDMFPWMASDGTVYKAEV